MKIAKIAAQVMITGLLFFGNHHRAGHFTVSGHRRAADQTGHAHAQAVAGEGFVQARVFGVVLPVTLPMAIMPPMCSMAGAMATGT